MFNVQATRRSLEAALRDARDPKSAVRLSAVEDLKHHAADGPGAAVKMLSEVVVHDASAQVRAAAALALADAGASAALPSLIKAADDAHEPVRQRALIAIGELATRLDETALRVVSGSLRDEAAAIRFQALIAGARMDLPAMEQSLLEATEDSDAHVRHVAFRLLEERVLARRGEAGADHEGALPEGDIIGAAERGLEDTAVSVRVAAAILLLEYERDALAETVLARAVNGRRVDVEPDDLEAAIRLVGEHAVKAAVPGLERRAFGIFGRDPFALAARVALAKMGHERARHAIFKGLSAWTRQARTLAVVAVGQVPLAEARDQVLAMRGDPRRAEPDAVEETLTRLGSIRV